MRHVLSDKIFSKNNRDNKLNHGYILGDLKPSTQIIQIRGTERLISKDEWSKVFEIEVHADAPRGEEQKTNGKLQPSDDPYAKALNVICPRLDRGLNCENKLIKLSDEEILSLFSHFEPTFSNFQSVIVNFLHSPYDKEDVQRLVSEWYFKAEHQNTETIAVFCDKYYEKAENNKWFFSIVNHLDDESKKEWRKKSLEFMLDQEADFDLNGDVNLNT